MTSSLRKFEKYTRLITSLTNPRFHLPHHQTIPKIKSSTRFTTLLLPGAVGACFSAATAFSVDFTVAFDAKVDAALATSADAFGCECCWRG